MGSSRTCVQHRAFQIDLQAIISLDDGFFVGFATVCSLGFVEVGADTWPYLFV